MAAGSRSSEATDVEGASEERLPATPTDGRVRATRGAAVHDNQSQLDGLQEHDSDYIHTICCTARR